MVDRRHKPKVMYCGIMMKENAARRQAIRDYKKTGIYPTIFWMDLHNPELGNRLETLVKKANEELAGENNVNKPEECRDHQESGR